jgi:superfamily II DNA or RNA helicase
MGSMALATAATVIASQAVITGAFSVTQPAVQLGLTATPKRTINADTYAYFGDPVYTYSLKDGINDGFLTPFKVKQISTTLDEYVYTADDTVVEGEIEATHGMLCFCEWNVSAAREHSGRYGTMALGFTRKFVIFYFIIYFHFFFAYIF